MARALSHSSAFPLFCLSSSFSTVLRTVLSLRHYFFFFQAEDGIRDYKVTGVQTCALPILFSYHPSHGTAFPARKPPGPGARPLQPASRAVRGANPAAANRAGNAPATGPQIGRASCRERV